MEKPGFLPRIESLRGIAALMVVGYHVGGHFSGGPATAGLDALIYRLFSAVSNGIGAVVAFFVISGFVLARSLDRDPDPSRFFRNRIFRLFPAAVAVVAIFSALHQQFGVYVMKEGSFDPVNIILNALLIRTDINPVMWSMKVECVATPMILAGVWALRKHGTWPLWIAGAVLFALSFWGPYVHMLGDATNMAAFYAFLTGIIVHFRGARLAAALGRTAAPIVALTAIAVFCLCGALKQTAWILLLECFAAAVVVALQGLPLLRSLDHSIVRFYGQISYSFYLLHPLGVLFALRLLGPAALAPNVPISLGAIILTVASIAVTTPFAYFFWRFIEVPGIAIGKRLFALRVKVPADNVIAEVVK
jgi:peptidoglycan/LPS O-acetylase OafA/YrhL